MIGSQRSTSLRQNLTTSKHFYFSFYFPIFLFVLVLERHPGACRHEGTSSQSLRKHALCRLTHVVTFVCAYPFVNFFAIFFFNLMFTQTKFMRAEGFPPLPLLALPLRLVRHLIDSQPCPTININVSKDAYKICLVRKQEGSQSKRHFFLSLTHQL